MDGRFSVTMRTAHRFGHNRIDNAETQQILRPVAGGLPLLAQILPLNTWQDERLVMQLARYDPQGEIAFINLSAVWDS